MPRRKTDEQFKQEVYDLVGNDYTFLDPYVNAYTNIKVKHNKCGNVYSVAPTNFLNGNRCPYCNGNAKKTDEGFKQEAYNLVGDEYTFLDSYIGSQTKIRVKHSKCGNIYEVRPNDFLKGSRCPYCFTKTIRKTDKQFKQEVYGLVGDEYVFLDSYVNAKTKIRVKHNKCESIYSVKPNVFLNGNRCPYCSGLIKKTNRQFKREVYDLVDNEYTFLDSYVNTRTKLRVKHNKCDNIYRVTPNSFISGSRCPYCNSPKGELIIDKILNSLKIKYEVQKTFNNLKDKSYLSYDFYIPSQNILIEYQGIQHYESIGYFGGDDTFETQQKHDQMKLDYAKDQGYSLITVPYTEDTLPKIKGYLIKHGLSYKEKLNGYTN